MVHWPLIGVAMVAAQGGFIYGLDSGRQSSQIYPAVEVTIDRYHRDHIWPRFISPGHVRAVEEEY